MGTQFSLTLYAPDSSTAYRVNQAVSARMDTLNQVMSDYLDGSEINRLSATAGSGQWVRVSPDLFDVLQKARSIARRSGGRFDPTVGPLSLLWRRAVRRQTFPDARERRQARRRVGYRFVQLDARQQRVRLRRRGMRLDLGGIGQGFANDEAARLLRSLGVGQYLLDLGGDVLAGEAPPGQPRGWRIGTGTLATHDTATVWLTRAAITTSGDAYRHLDYQGRRYSHIMNPRSGLGLRHVVRTTVQAPEGYLADALTKVFSVAGQSTGRRLLRRFPGARVQRLQNEEGQLRVWQSAPFGQP
ncbi:FAD:protein FMN transferase [Spirosoma luteolum]